MAINKHVVAVLDSPTPSAFSDRVFVGQQLGIANAVGSGAGATVSTVVTFPEELPSVFTAIVQPSQAAVWWISAKTAFGFTVNIAPLLPATTLAAGTFDVVLLSA
jgi:hypothetical protein